ncbi:MAG TPA: ribose ABC transporter permease [Ruminococcaceae bacterium]|nr:ribose ABC transporter permease [Oscillospiraceae bacterium]
MRLENTLKGNSVKSIASKYGIYLVLVLMVVISSIASPNFLTVSNILSVLRQSSPTIILAFGAMFLMISGSMDLSVGSVLAISGIFSLSVYMMGGSWLGAILAGIMTGLVCCTLSGIISAYVGVPSFIVTLAMDLIVRGGVMLYTGGMPITRTGNFAAFGQGFIGPIPIPIVVVAVIWAVSAFILNHTTLGRKFYAIGGNAEAARASGINVKRTTLFAYFINGIFVAIAGIIFMSRLNSGTPGGGDGYALDAIASTVIGGSSLSGGIGTATGTLVGAIIMGLISNILNLVSVQSYVQSIVKGVIIVLAVVLDISAKKKSV